MVDLLRFVSELATDAGARDAFRRDPERVLATSVDGARSITGEDVDAVAEVVRTRSPAGTAALVEVRPPVRPVGGETPHDAALRLLVDLCDALDGPPAEVVTLPHRELEPDPPPPAQTARGGGEPVPTEPPGGRWLHPVIPDDEP